MNDIYSTGTSLSPAIGRFPGDRPVDVPLRDSLELNCSKGQNLDANGTLLVGLRLILNSEKKKLKKKKN